jgi:hypothetical protein
MSKKATPKPVAECPQPGCDGCDTKLEKVETPNESRKRFLTAYQERPVIARAARLAGVHRCTVYRWQADPEFVKAMREAADAFFRELRARIAVEEAERKRWREERERARRPMRCRNLALAQAARQKGKR